MSERKNHVLTQAMLLSPTERAAVADQLIASLGLPEKDQDRIWSREADCFVEAYERGTLNAISGKKEQETIST